MQHVFERVGTQTPVRLAVDHADSATDAAWLMDSAKVQMSPIETIITPLSPVISTRAGQQTVAGLAYTKP